MNHTKCFPAVLCSVSKLLVKRMLLIPSIECVFETNENPITWWRLYWRNCCCKIFVHLFICNYMRDAQTYRNHNASRQLRHFPENCRQKRAFAWANLSNHSNQLTMIDLQVYPEKTNRLFSVSIKIEKIKTVFESSAKWIIPVINWSSIVESLILPKTSNFLSVGSTISSQIHALWEIFILMNKIRSSLRDGNVD